MAKELDTEGTEPEQAGTCDMDGAQEQTGKKRKRSQEIGKQNKKRRIEQEKQSMLAADLEKIQKETVEKIRRINPHYQFDKPLTDDGKRSAKAEHVINNGVITFYRRVVDDFLKQSNYQANISLPDSPLDTDTKKGIRDLAFDFSKVEPYVNANAFVYGEYSKVLKEALVHFLKVHSQTGTTPEEKQRAEDRVSDIVRHMNDVQAYVDEFAWGKMIEDCKLKTRGCEIIKDVKAMFTNWTKYFDAVRAKVEEFTEGGKEAI